MAAARSMTLGQRLKAAVGLFTGQLTPEVQGMLAGILPGGRGEPPPKGSKEFLEAYGNMPWLRAASENVARSYAAVRWWVATAKSAKTGKAFRCQEAQRGGYEGRAKAIKHLKTVGELKEIDEHPMLDLLYRGNQFFTGTQNRKLQCLYLDHVGEAPWLKQRNAMGVPEAAWPIPPHWVLETPTPSHRSYRVSFMGWQRDIPETEILWFSEPNPVNPYGRGLGLARALADELDTDDAAAKHARSFFFNKGRPDLLIAGEGIGEADMKHLEQRWREKSRRFIQQFAIPLFVNKAVKVQELGQTMKDMQFTDLREFERNTVQQVWGLPPEAMGIIENSNRATIDAADYLKSRQVLEPRLETTREILQERLVPEYDDRLIVGYDSPVMEDREFHLNVAKAAPHTLTVDEWREMAGKSPLEGDQGKVHIFTGLAMAVRDMGELETPAEQSARTTPEPEAGDEEDEAAEEEKRARAETLALKLALKREELAIEREKADAAKLSAQAAVRAAEKDVPAPVFNLTTGKVEVPVDVHVPPAQVTIGEGAVKVVTPVNVTVPPAPEKPAGGSKRIEVRDGEGRVVRSMEMKQEE